MRFVVVIARHMRWGRQEDAHEFLRYVVDALQRAALVGVPKYVVFSTVNITVITMQPLNCCAVALF